MERSVNGDDPGEIETGEVIKRDPGASLAGDPGEIEVVELREGDQEAAWGDRSEAEPDLSEPEPVPDADPGEIELEDIVGDVGEREIGA